MITFKNLSHDCFWLDFLENCKEKINENSSVTHFSSERMMTDFS